MHDPPFSTFVRDLKCSGARSPSQTFNGTAHGIINQPEQRLTLRMLFRPTAAKAGKSVRNPTNLPFERSKLQHLSATDLATLTIRIERKASVNASHRSPADPDSGASGANAKRNPRVYDSNCIPAWRSSSMIRNLYANPSDAREEIR